MGRFKAEAFTPVKDGKVHFEGGGYRESADDKPRHDLLWLKGIPYEVQPLTRAAQHMADGAKKYEERNHENMRSQEALDRAVASTLRHVLQWATGEMDEDHAAAVVCNIVMAEGIRTRMEYDAVSE